MKTAHHPAMTNRVGPTQLALALGAAAAVFGALALVLVAAFPYIYAESGSGRYAREHRAEAIGALVAAAVLLWVAWQCMRRSLPARTWAMIGLGALAVVLLPIAAAYFKRP